MMMALGGRDAAFVTLLITMRHATGRRVVGDTSFESPLFFVFCETVGSAHNLPGRMNLLAL